jgi:hypothetical protein|nr:MAG TPA: ERF superfamily protein [Caudoviricetes sp.]
MEEKKKMSIYETIPAVMAEIGAIGKDSWNKQGFAYRGIDAVMNALNPAMTKYKMFVIPKVLDQRREERQAAKGSNLIYSICTVEYTFYAEDGSSVSATVIGEGMDSGDKATNKAMSAAFKYACFQTFCIPTEEMKDPDAETPPPSEPAKPVLEAKYVNTLYTELQRTGIGISRILREYKVADVHDLTFDDWKKAMDILKGKPDKPAPEVPDKADEGLPWN